MYVSELETLSEGGKLTLYFGCRKDSVDNIYRDELKTAVEKGVLQQAYIALSRDARPKVRENPSYLKLFYIKLKNPPFKNDLNSVKAVCNSKRKMI